jgi:hypothetical protein
MRCEVVRLLESDSELTSVYLAKSADYAKLLHRRFHPNRTLTLSDYPVGRQLTRSNDRRPTCRGRIDRDRQTPGLDKEPNAASPVPEPAR